LKVWHSKQHSAKRWAFGRGQYRPTVPTWVASDAELKEDPGVGMRWWASDAEVKDDPGFQMGNPPTEVTCKSFSLSSYDLDPLAEGSGSIHIGEEHYAFAPHDVFVVPPWYSYRFSADTECVLFSFSDRAGQEALGFWREQFD